jgi:hypothetical protein
MVGLVARLPLLGTEVRCPAVGDKLSNSSLDSDCSSLRSIASLLIGGAEYDRTSDR